MYIEFTDDYASALNSQQENDLWEPIEHAYDAYKNKYHFIFCESRNCAIKILKIAEKRNRNDIALLFKQIHDNFSQMGDIKENLLVFASIIPETNLLQLSCDKKEIQIGIDLAKKSELWQKTIFLPEDIDDDCYFKMIIDSQKKKKNNPLCFLEYNYEPDNAGGSAAYRTLKTKGTQPHFVFGIFDSDCKNPDNPTKIGATASAVTSHKYPETVSYIILNLHELENLFYSEAFITKYASKSYRKEILDNHNRLKRYNPEYEKYFDTKTGYTIKNAYSGCNFLFSFFEKDKVECDVYQSHSQKCQKCEECKVHIFKTCSGEIKAGLKKDFFDETNHISKNIEDLIVLINHSPTFIQEEWERIFYNSISWFCYSSLEARA